MVSPSKRRAAESPKEPDSEIYFKNISLDAFSLVDLARENSSLTIVTPRMARYAAMTYIYSRNISNKPLAIVRPRSISEVSTIVKYAFKRNIKITVRVGGHEMFGRSMADDALVIGLRDLNGFRLVDEGRAAVIEGGIIRYNLIKSLAGLGYTTPFAAAPSVGYVGWATLGGYGLLSGAYGLGVDQILSAKLVNAMGEVVDADADMLYAIRGGGGSIGIIVEMKIKIYRLRSVLAGIIAFESTDLTTTFKQFCLGYRTLQHQGIPSPFGCQIAVVNLPGLGRTLMTTFMWASAHLEPRREWLALFKSLANSVMDNVSKMTIPDFMDMTKDFGSYNVYNGMHSLNVPELSDTYLNVVAKYVEKMPSASATLFFMHELRGPSTTDDNGSSFAARKSHFVVEIIGSTKEEELKDASYSWADGFHAELEASFVKMEGSYVALVKEPEVSVPKCYGEKWPKLQEMKRKYDPHNVFRFAVPQFEELWAPSELSSLNSHAMWLAELAEGGAKV